MHTYKQQYPYHPLSSPIIPYHRIPYHVHHNHPPEAVAPNEAVHPPLLPQPTLMPFFCTSSKLELCDRQLVMVSTASWELRVMLNTFIVGILAALLKHLPENRTWYLKWESAALQFQVQNSKYFILSNPNLQLVAEKPCHDMDDFPPSKFLPNLCSFWQPALQSLLPSQHGRQLNCTALAKASGKCGRRERHSIDYLISLILKRWEKL